jgi:hypothetical protein
VGIRPLLDYLIEQLKGRGLRRPKGSGTASTDRLVTGVQAYLDDRKRLRITTRAAGLIRLSSLEVKLGRVQLCGSSSAMRRRNVHRCPQTISMG